MQSWVQRESAAGLLTSAYEADRHALLREGWLPRSPTWIQSTTTVNLGDFPALDNSVERAERDLKTLEWVIEEQRRLAAGKPAAPGGDAQESAPDHWLRTMLPAHWISLLKANREWVAAGGTALLVIVWGTAAFARRPTTHPLPAAPPPPRRRRRRHATRHTPG